MSDFTKLCNAAEAIDPIDYAAVLTVKAAKILPKLNAITGDRAHSAALFTSFLIASVCADGQIDEAEYAIMLPMLEIVFGEDFDYAAAKALAKELRPESKAFKKAVNEIVDELGKADEELKDDIVIVCLLICAIDGKITLKEKNYIRQLIR